MATKRAMDNHNEKRMKKSIQEDQRPSLVTPEDKEFLLNLKVAAMGEKNKAIEESHKEMERDRKMAEESGRSVTLQMSVTSREDRRPISAHTERITEPVKAREISRNPFGGAGRGRLTNMAPGSDGKTSPGPPADPKNKFLYDPARDGSNPPVPRGRGVRAPPKTEQLESRGVRAPPKTDQLESRGVRVPPKTEQFESRGVCAPPKTEQLERNLSAAVVVVDPSAAAMKPEPAAIVRPTQRKYGKPGSGKTKPPVMTGGANEVEESNSVQPSRYHQWENKNGISTIERSQGQYGSNSATYPQSFSGTAENWNNEVACDPVSVYSERQAGSGGWAREWDRGKESSDSVHYSAKMNNQYSNLGHPSSSAGQGHLNFHTSQGHPTAHTGQGHSGLYSVLDHDNSHSAQSYPKSGQGHQTLHSSFSHSGQGHHTLHPGQGHGSPAIERWDENTEPQWPADDQRMKQDERHDHRDSSSWGRERQHSGGQQSKQYGRGSRLENLPPRLARRALEREQLNEDRVSTDNAMDSTNLRGRRGRGYSKSVRSDDHYVDDHKQRPSVHSRLGNRATNFDADKQEDWSTGFYGNDNSRGNVKSRLGYQHNHEDNWSNSDKGYQGSFGGQRANEGQRPSRGQGSYRRGQAQRGGRDRGVRGGRYENVSRRQFDETRASYDPDENLRGQSRSRGGRGGRYNMSQQRHSSDSSRIPPEEFPSVTGKKSPQSPVKQKGGKRNDLDNSWNTAKKTVPVEREGKKKDEEEEWEDVEEIKPKTSYSSRRYSGGRAKKMGKASDSGASKSSGSKLQGATTATALSKNDLTGGVKDSVEENPLTDQISTGCVSFPDNNTPQSVPLSSREKSKKSSTATEPDDDADEWEDDDGDWEDDDGEWEDDDDNDKPMATLSKNLDDVIISAGEQPQQHHHHHDVIGPEDHDDESQESFSKFVEDNTLRLNVNVNVDAGFNDSVSSASSQVPFSPDSSFLRTPPGGVVLDWGAAMDELSQERARLGLEDP